MYSSIAFLFFLPYLHNILCTKNVDFRISTSYWHISQKSLNFLFLWDIPLFVIHYTWAVWIPTYVCGLYRLLLLLFAHLFGRIIFAVFAQYFFQFSVYFFSSKLWCKNYMVLTPILAVGWISYLIIFFHLKNLLYFEYRSPNHYYTGGSSLFKVFRLASSSPFLLSLPLFLPR